VLTYRELRERAREFGQGLVRLGLAKGERILLIADTDPDFMVAFCGCQYAGVLPVPVALPMTLGGRAAYVEQLRHQLTGCGAVAAMAPEGFLTFLNEAAQGLNLKLVGGPKDFAALPRDGADLRPFGKDDQSYLQFSSGSTRFPKGIDIPQRSIMANANAITLDGLDINRGDRCTSWLPLYHDMGLVGFMLVPLTTQMSIDYIATRDFARRSLTWLKLISEYGGTLSYSPSFGYELCTAACARAARSSSTSRPGAAPASAATWCSIRSCRNSPTLSDRTASAPMPSCPATAWRRRRWP
jgi:fatty-acyl-CoA synthase